jgi:hypothetical protein
MEISEEEVRQMWRLSDLLDKTDGQGHESDFTKIALVAIAVALVVGLVLGRLLFRYLSAPGGSKIVPN